MLAKHSAPSIHYWFSYLCLVGLGSIGVALDARGTTSQQCHDQYQETMEVVNDPFAYKPRNSAQQAQAALDLCLSRATVATQSNSGTPRASNTKEILALDAQSPLSRDFSEDEFDALGHPNSEATGVARHRQASSLRAPTRVPPRDTTKHRLLVRALGLMTGTSQKLDREAARKIYAELDPNDPVLLDGAERGEPYSLEFIGSAFIRGDGVEKDLPRGEAMLRRAAERGNIMAMYHLGTLAHTGEGSNRKVDHAQAAHWLKLAADKGHASAQTTYGAMLWSGTGVQKDRTMALPYFERAAAKGDAEANYNLGIVYSTGSDGSHASFLKAIKHFEVAEKGQHDKASIQLQQLRRKAADNVALAMAATGMAPIRSSSDFASYFGACGSSAEVVSGLPPALRNAALICVSNGSSRCGKDVGVPKCGAVHFGFDEGGNALWAMLSITGHDTDSKMVESFRKRFGPLEPVSRQRGQYLQSHFAWSMVGYKVEVDAFSHIGGRESVDPFALAWVVID